VADLRAIGFRECGVTAKRLDIVHASQPNEGPFCRLAVEDCAPECPGVYAWVQDSAVMYVGRASQLRQVVHGTQMGRPYNDYTYIPASKVAQTSSPRVRINALLNLALSAGSTVSWWWLETTTPEDSVSLEATLINQWKPPWNRAVPALRWTHL
jgi:hypothetical protein